jgi:hypothetical protein
MYLIRVIAKRSKGMKLKLMKFHGIVHMADDILNFGVPMEFDTGSNESGHKATKTAAKLTQRNEVTFDYQTSIRLEETHLLEMAKQEISERPIWTYGQERPILPTEALSGTDTPIGGTSYYVTVNNETGTFDIQTPNKTPGVNEEVLEVDLLKFLWDLQECVREYLPSVPLRTIHKRHDTLFRGQALFRGGVWRDWALIDWGIDTHLPAKMYGFVDLRELPSRPSLYFADIRLKPGIYAVVESASYNPDAEEQAMSELFIPITKEVGAMLGPTVWSLKFYLADVEAIVKPLAVIPDLGGPPNNYFIIKDRATWREDFIAFLEEDLDVETAIQDVYEE